MGDRQGVWRERAACRGNWELDWIDPSPADEAVCRAICRRCPVRVECGEDALLSGEPWGLWGGLDPHERAIIAAHRSIPTPRMLPPHGTNPRYAKHGCRCPACRSAHTTYERGRRARSA
jgi:hypothetical protein